MQDQMISCWLHFINTELNNKMCVCFSKNKTYTAWIKNKVIILKVNASDQTNHRGHIARTGHRMQRMSLCQWCLDLGHNITAYNSEKWQFYVLLYSSTQTGAELLERMNEWTWSIGHLQMGAILFAMVDTSVWQCRHTSCKNVNGHVAQARCYSE